MRKYDWNYFWSSHGLREKEGPIRFERMKKEEEKGESSFIGSLGMKRRSNTLGMCSSHTAIMGGAWVHTPMMGGAWSMVLDRFD